MKSVISKDISIFDFMGYVTHNKKKWQDIPEHHQKKYSQYMMNRWLSMNIDLIEVVNYFQKYTIGLLSTRDSYKLFHDFLPKQKFFSKYIKGKKSEKFNQDLINYIKIHFLVSNKEAIEYIELFLLQENGKDQLYGILQKYGVPEKEITKLLKF